MAGSNEEVDSIVLVGQVCQIYPELPEFLLLPRTNKAILLDCVLKVEPLSLILPSTGLLQKQFKRAGRDT